MRVRKHDVMVVGGGFFGCSLASHIASTGLSVALAEQSADLLQRASFSNQARIHNGYHYPRSLLTALRSRVNYPRFRQEFAGCVVDNFRHYYAVPTKFSKVTANQFRRFMERIGSPIRPAPKKAAALFSSALIEEVFEVDECAFDAVALKTIAARRLQEAGVDLHLGTEVREIRRRASHLEVVCSDADGEVVVEAQTLINSTYSRINSVLNRAGLPSLKLKHEIAEMALVEIPDEIRDMAFTVMCGPFFSLVPFPARGLHTLSHVRYTPHCSWLEGPGQATEDAYAIFSQYPKKSKFEHMRRDAARYLPALSRLTQHDSVWEVKTVLPQSEADDSRPILFRQAQDEPRIWSIMGGKIDNIYDAIEQWDGLEGNGGGRRSEIGDQTPEPSPAPALPPSHP